MLFNSYEFLLGFLPLSVGIFFLLGTVSRTWALRWIIVASLFFYAWWRPLNVLIIFPSIVVNFVVARGIQRLVKQGHRPAATTLLMLGIAFNVAFLGYFKYAAFFATAVNDAFGTNWLLANVILPLGISFITFQKIAFLVDVHAGRIDSFTVQDYCLFVLFFPQLIAGPIVHYRELMPQFHRAPCVFDSGDVAVGLTLFFCGLVKKVFLADSIAPSVSTIFAHAALGHPLSFLSAWMAAIGFTLQIYFDFSGYTDMALGTARLFGIRLPPNFNSPLKASSIIDFWLRWHMTLTRFLTAYVYNPLALALTRRRLARGRSVLAGPQTTAGAFVQLVLLPTLLTMLVSGIWHGAGYLFALWGLTHGVFLTINHGWRLVGPRRSRDRAETARPLAGVPYLLTSLCVVTSMVLFRSPTMRAARVVLRGLIGLDGIGLPGLASDRWGFLSRWSHGPGAIDSVLGDFHPGKLALWICLLALIACVGPNTLQLLGRHAPALGWESAPAERGAGPHIRWAPSLSWAFVLSILVIIGILSLGGQSEFLYWQF